MYSVFRMFSGEALPKEEVCLGIKQRGSRCALLWEISPGRESLASFVEYRVAAVGRSRAWSLKIERGSNKKGRAEGWPGFVGEARRGGGGRPLLALTPVLASWSEVLLKMLLWQPETLVLNLTDFGGEDKGG